MIRAAERAGLPARVGVAASKLAARIAAGLPDSPTVVPPGGEHAFLAPLPLERLAPEMETAATLERWGLRTIGDLARLPEGEVASRLGELGRALHASANGFDARPLEPYLPPPAFSEGTELEWPLASLEPFLFVAHTALERLVRRLESRALACTRLEIALTLDPDGHDARAISLPAPTRDVKTLLTLVRLELEARPPGAAVAAFVFSAHPDRPRRAQLSLFGPAALSPDRLATTIARLAALLGEDRVGSPRSTDGHRPERFTLTRYEPPPPPVARAAPRRGRGLLSVRTLRPPVPLEVVVEDGLERATRPPSPRPSPPAARVERGSLVEGTHSSPCHPERSEGSLSDPKSASPPLSSSAPTLSAGERGGEARSDSRVFTDLMPYSATSHPERSEGSLSAPGSASSPRSSSSPSLPAGGSSTPSRDEKSSSPQSSSRPPLPAGEGRGEGRSRTELRENNSSTLQTALTPRGVHDSRSGKGTAADSDRRTDGSRDARPPDPRPLDPTGPGSSRSRMEYRHLPKPRDPRVPPEAAHTIVPPLPSGEGSFGPGSFFDVPPRVPEITPSPRAASSRASRDGASPENARRHRPVSVQSPPGATPAISGRVRVASGPWSLEEGWWTESPVDRDYWDVELSDGALYRIYRERRGGAWFADGIYD